MTTLFLIIGLAILIITNVVSFFLIKTLLSKISIYEEWILDFKTDVINTLEKMREIDKQGIFATSLNESGIFESDDQVGEIFKELMALVEKLNERNQ